MEAELREAIQDVKQSINHELAKIESKLDILFASDGERGERLASMEAKMESQIEFMQTFRANEQAHGKALAGKVAYVEKRCDTLEDRMTAFQRLSLKLWVSIGGNVLTMIALVLTVIFALSKIA